MTEHTDYMICGALDAPKRLLGMPIDISLPMIVIFAVSMLLRLYILGIVVCLIWFMLTTAIKKKYGNNVLLVILYRKTTQSLSQFLLTRFPDPTIRYWW